MSVLRPQDKEDLDGNNKNKIFGPSCKRHKRLSVYNNSINGTQLSQEQRSQDEEDLEATTQNFTTSLKCLKNVDHYNSKSSEQLQEQEDSAAGILQWVTVKNFMCHDHLNFTFSPNINFVQGRNGSGKSAIASAVVVGLGGTARVTNRGKNTQGLVKYGKQTATIEIALKNTGKEAFKHELYGDTIIVERKIQIKGGGGYKIKAKNGSVVSVKKDEVQRMLDHFNIQVDNPITILNQDMSRDFLNTADSKGLYKFFLKATQLQQMKDDYNHLQKALKISSDIIQNRKEHLPLLKKEVDEQRTQYEFSVSLNDKRKKLHELRKELVWAMIIQAEKEEVASHKELERHESSVKAVQDKISSYATKSEEEQNLYRKIQEELNNISSKIKGLSSKVKKAREDMVDAKMKHKDKQMQFNTAERKIQNIQKEISVLKEAVERDYNDAWTIYNAELPLWEEKMKAVENELDVLEHSKNTEETHFVNIQNTLNLKENCLETIHQEQIAIKLRCQALEKELRGLKSNKSTVYGQWVPQLLAAVDSAHSKGAFIKKPVGPLGEYIKLGNEKWGHVAEKVLGNRITSFRVDNHKDKMVLKTIMRKIFGNTELQPSIIVSKFRDQVHNVSYEVQSDKYPSLWSILIVEDTVVANTLLDEMKVESILLIPTAKEAGHILKDKAAVPKNCMCAFTLNCDTYYPDPNYRLHSGRGQRPTKYLQVSVEQKQRETQAELEHSKENLKACHQKMIDMRAEISELKNECNASRKKSLSIKQAMDKLHCKQADLRNQKPSPPTDVCQLEEDIRQQETVLKEAQDNFQKIKEDIASSKDAFTKASSEFENVTKEEKDQFKIAENEKEKLSLAEGRMNKQIHAMDIYKKKEKELQKVKKEAEMKLKAASEKLERQLERASDFQPRMDTVRSVEEIQRQYSGLEARLNKERAQAGDPLKIAERYKATKERYSAVSSEIESHNNLIKKIKESVSVRLGQFKYFRKLLSIMIKSTFKSSLVVRKLNGSLNFDFEKEELTLSVVKIDSERCTDKQSIVKSGNKKVPKQSLAMMSGGERSFSTVAFIIALWEVMESPVRILDEFDVFMDIVARQQSMTMMIDASKSRTQYIYLTPLDINLSFNKKKNPSIYRMPDPERNAADRN